MRSSHFSRAFLMALVVLSTVGCDQATKHIARSTAPHGISILGGTLEFTLTSNPGGFLSLGQGLPHAVRQAAFLTFSSAFVAVLLFVSWRLRHRSSALFVVAASLLVSGAVGNLIDRFFQQGFVTDFCVLHIGPLRTGVFNVADVALMCGAALIVASKEHQGTATA